MECKKCSAIIPDDGLFCPKCGARVDGNKICPKCEKLIPEDSIFCTYCGMDVGEKQPAVSVPKQEKVVEEKNLKPVPEENNEDEQEVLAPEIEDEGQKAEDVVDSSIEKLEKTTDTKEVEEESIVEENVNDGDFAEISNNIENQTVESFEGVTVDAFMLPKEVDEKTFFAEALTKIAFNKTSPDNIFEIGKFEPVKTEYRQYLYAKGFVDMTYSATVGYDRKEEYYEKVKKYNSSTHSYYYEDVKKTRTVTDWQPFSGSYRGEQIGYVANDDETTESDLVDYNFHCAKRATEYNTENNSCPAPQSPTQMTINNVKSSIKHSAQAECIRGLPGDHSKDFNSAGTVNLLLIEAHVAPQYILNYSYMGATCSMKAHTVKESKIDGNCPSVKKQINKEIENHKLVMPFNLITFFTLIFAIISSIFFSIGFKIAFAVVGLVLFIANCIVKSKISKTIYQEKENKKKKTLVELLKRKGIEIPKELKEGLGV